MEIFQKIFTTAGGCDTSDKQELWLSAYLSVYCCPEALRLVSSNCVCIAGLGSFFKFLKPKKLCQLSGVILQRHYAVKNCFAH